MIKSIVFKIIKNKLTIIILLVIFILIASCRDARCFEDNFYISNADFKEIEKHRKNIEFVRDKFVMKDTNKSSEKEDFIIFGHRIIESKRNNIIIGIRKYRAVFIEGNDSYKKLTISLPDNIIKEKGELILTDKSNFIIYYSTGSISSSPNIEMFYGYAKSGIIRYNKIADNKYLLDIFLVFDTKNKWGTFDYYKNNNGIVLVSIKTEIIKKNIDDLTPWEGKDVSDYFKEGCIRNEVNKSNTLKEIIK